MCHVIIRVMTVQKSRPRTASPRPTIDWACPSERWSKSTAHISRAKILSRGRIWRPTFRKNPNHQKSDFLENRVTPSHAPANAFKVVAIAWRAGREKNNNSPPGPLGVAGHGGLRSGREGGERKMATYLSTQNQVSGEKQPERMPLRRTANV